MKRSRFDAFSRFERLAKRLEEGEGDAGGGGRSWRARALRIVLVLLLLEAALVLPFVVLVGGSVHLHRSFNIPTWPALLAAMLLTVLVLLVYAAWLARRLTGRARVPRLVVRGAAALVLAYSLYALIYLSSLNVKAGEVGDYYRSLHPLLRVAVSTFVLVDSDLVITDMGREPDDYVRMGLPIRGRSMHYEQSDGYVHAVDLRTLGHGWVRNTLLQLYFATMGFRTVRHVGTADHLHVSLPMPG